MNLILNSIMSIVSETTEVSEELIKSSSKREDVVLARKLFVFFCIELGISSTTLAIALNKSQRAIRRLYLDSVNEEYRIIYRIYSVKIKTEIRNKIMVNVNT